MDRVARMICECGSFPIGFFLQPLILSTNFVIWLCLAVQIKVVRKVLL